MRADTTLPIIRARHEAANLRALRNVFADQRADVVVAGRTLGEEWDRRLASVLFNRNQATAVDVGSQVARQLKATFDPDLLEAWLTTNAELGATFINDSTRSALDDTEDRGAVFDILTGSSAAMYARSMVTSAAGVAANDAARSGGARFKVWQVNSGNPRSGHAALNGERVPLGDSFSNGMNWPGDPAGGAENNAGCQCSIVYSD